MANFDHDRRKTTDSLRPVALEMIELVPLDESLAEKHQPSRPRRAASFAAWCVGAAVVSFATMVGFEHRASLTATLSHARMAAAARRTPVRDASVKAVTTTTRVTTTAPATTAQAAAGSPSAPLAFSAHRARASEESGVSSRTSRDANTPHTTSSPSPSTSVTATAPVPKVRPRPRRDPGAAKVARPSAVAVSKPKAGSVSADGAPKAGRSGTPSEEFAAAAALLAKARGERALE